MKEFRYIEILEPSFGKTLTAFKERLIFDAATACCPNKSTQDVLSDNHLLYLYYYSKYKSKHDNKYYPRQKTNPILDYSSDTTSVLYKGTNIVFHNNSCGYTPHIINTDVIILFIDNFERIPYDERIQKAKVVFLIADVTKWGRSKNKYKKSSALYFRVLNNWLSSFQATASHIQFIELFCQPMKGWMSSDWRRYNPHQSLADLFHFKYSRSKWIDNNRKLQNDNNFTFLLDLILEHTSAVPILDGPLQMNIYNDIMSYGVVTRGKMRVGQTVFLHKTDGTVSNKIIRSIMIPAGNGVVNANEVQCGESCYLQFEAELLYQGDVICEVP